MSSDAMVSMFCALAVARKPAQIIFCQERAQTSHTEPVKPLCLSSIYVVEVYCLYIFPYMTFY